MIHVYVVSLGSGSSGNATLLRATSGECVLVDCGVAPPRLLRYLSDLGVPPASLRAVVLTHEHGDHTQSAGVLAMRYGVPLYASPGTAASGTLTGLQPHQFPTQAAWQIGAFTFMPYRVPHDADATYGFLIQADGCRVALFTDLGTGADTLAPVIASADLVIVEANHDREMLTNGSYPWWLKSRIGGKNGHLSNDQCADLLVRALADDRPREVWLAHLSAQNNTPQRAKETVTAVLTAAGLVNQCVTSLPRTDPGPAWEMVRVRQLSLWGDTNT